ncbi:IS5 family transposase [Mangrovactinospora gilvigrisea]|uniref:IS5 family transposase n=1 Tax=Mangrovactinospora gilvigrisea TaxID=1428644 RepID=A0A1J7BEK6_9ACTN|nr:IS5/IS1182 family transposase [Mangrovactinospora gilvigrisea]OIV37115.1 IS5 family transposase [Mangrovactinospora gilvigrisea]
MMVYPSGLDLSSSTLRYLTHELARRRVVLGTRWRCLSAGRQALLVLTHLRVGHTHAQPAAGFRIGIATAFRYIREAVDVLAARAATLKQAAAVASGKAHVILDGTLLPIDRIAADRPFYSGKHRKHGMNVQVIADPIGRLIWASPALAGAVHDSTHGIIDALTEAGVTVFADRGYRGARGTVRTPIWGRGLPRGPKLVNITHAKIRAAGERAIATLKTWRLLRKLRCSTNRITAVAQAIMTLHHVSSAA